MYAMPGLNLARGRGRTRAQLLNLIFDIAYIKYQSKIYEARIKM